MPDNDDKGMDDSPQEHGIVYRGGKRLPLPPLQQDGNMEHGLPAAEPWHKPWETTIPPE